MKTASKITTLALLGTFVATALSPVLADPSSQQKNKNQWRNLGILGAAVAGYGLLKHNQTATILGAAGAAYSANRYEKDRQHQSQDRSNRRYYYNNNNGGYNNNGGEYDGQTYQSFGRHHDNGKHKGEYKKHGEDHKDRGDRNDENGHGEKD